MASTDVSGLMKWLARDPWRNAFLDVLDEHVGEILDAYDLGEFDDLTSLIDVHWTMTVWGCAFEDFLTRNVPGAGNMIEDYLRRRGWKETALTRAYIAGLRNSAMSLYEASDIRPGESFLARDLIRGGEPVLITERTATKTLKPWDRLAMRVIDQRGKYVIGGGLLPIELDVCQSLIETIGNMEASDPGILRQLAPVFTDAFLASMIERVLGDDIPAIINSEGDAIEFFRIVFRLAKNGTSAQIRTALKRSPELEAADEDVWNWIEPLEGDSQSERLPETGNLKWQVTSASGNIILGKITLKPDRVEMNVNSEARAERGQAMLTSVLDGLVKFPLMERQTLEHALAETSGSSAKDSKLDLEPEEELRLVHDVMNRHYGKQLDEPVPALGNISPRKAATTEEGRQRLEEWLKYLENQNARAGPDHPMASYDTTWLWKELGIPERRK